MLHEDSDFLGEHPVNQYTATGDTPSMYPPDADRVVLYEAPEPEYVGLVVLDADGLHIGQNTRSRRRVEDALDGDPGYDMVVQPAPTA